MKRLKTLLADQRGVTGMTFAMSLSAILGMAAITVDLGRAFVTRSELQNIADSTALAAAGKLGLVYQDIATTNGNAATSNVTLSGNENGSITTVANSMANLHNAGGKSNIALAANDISVGTFNTSTEVVASTLTSPDSVTIRVRRDATQNGPLTTIFAAIFGNSTLGVSATATAALGPASSVPPGAMTAPFGIDERWFLNGGQCNNQIQFSPTNSPVGCAGWHVYDEGQLGSNPNNPAHCSTSGGGGGGGGGNANAKLLREIIDCLAADNYTSPEVTPHQTQFDFTNGVVANAFNNLDNLYNSKKDSNGNWEITIPVYADQNCGPANGTMTIVGFARAVVTNIDTQNKIIDAQVQCDAIIPDAPSGAPGSGLGGLSPKGSIPGLVS